MSEVWEMRDTSESRNLQMPRQRTPQQSDRHLSSYGYISPHIIVSTIWETASTVSLGISHRNTALLSRQSRLFT